MKRLLLRLFLAVLVLSAINIHSQDECKVLVPQISNQYIGKCKKGLASGKGLAIGIDRYQGTFKKGYPDGKGTYTWSNGEVYTGEWLQGERNGIGEFSYVKDGKAAFKSGVWESDLYIGPVPEKPKIIYTLGIEKYYFQRQGDGNQITINFYISGSNNNSIEDLSVLTSSGTMFRTGGTVGVEAIVFPLTCKVSYYSWNKMHTSRVQSRFEFQITQKGRWILNLHNN